jgi:hypothetical protein
MVIDTVNRAGTIRMGNEAAGPQAGLNRLKGWGKLNRSGLVTFQENRIWMKNLPESTC